MDNSDIILKNEKDKSSLQVIIANDITNNRNSNFDIVNKPIDIRDEQNDFLKKIFRKYKNDNSKLKRKHKNKEKNFINIRSSDNIINQTKMESHSKSSGVNKKNIKKNEYSLCRNFFKKFKFVNPNKNLSFDEEFPVCSLKDSEKEDICTRFLLLSLNILLAFFFIGLKASLTNNFGLATFCDLRTDWEEFDNMVNNKTIIMIKEEKCKIKCDFKGYVVSKLFHFDYYIGSFLAFFSFFKNFDLTHRKSVKIFLFIFPFMCNLISNIIFFKQKVIGFIFITFFMPIGIIVLLLESKNLFLISFTIAIPIGYYSFLKFFFDYLFFYILNFNPIIIRMILPIIISLLKFVYFNLILKIWKLKHIRSIHKWVCCTILCLFDFIFIGNLHLLVENGFDNYSFWINLSLNLLMDFSSKFQLNSKICLYLKNCFKKQKQIFDISDFDAISLAFSLESEIYAITSYFFLIMFGYFNMTLNGIVDCFGRPLRSEVKINNNHYILVSIYLIFWTIKLFIKCVSQKYIFKNEKNYAHFPKVQNRWEAITHVIGFYGISLNFCYSGLFSMFSIK